jgi:hypothetical protein
VLAAREFAGGRPLGQLLVGDVDMPLEGVAPFGMILFHRAPPVRQLLDPSLVPHPVKGDPALGDVPAVAGAIAVLSTVLIAPAVPSSPTPAVHAMALS